MTDRPPDSAPLGRGAAIAGGIALAVIALLAIGLVVLVVIARDGGGIGAAATPAVDAAAFAYADTQPAPALELTDQEARPFALASQLGRPVFVFFGYTHCPDVCPVTIGLMNEVLAAAGSGPRAVFTSIDPERDDVAAMKSYLRYLPKGYYGLSGTPQEIRTNADRWGVKYAKIDEGSAGGYAMAHTADVFLVDAQGRLRAHFPFGTPAQPMIDAVQALLAETPAPSDAPAAASASGPASTATAAPGSATPGASAAPGTASTVLLPEVLSTSIWAGSDPVILRAVDDAGTPLDATAPVSVQLTAIDGTPQGAAVTAVPVRPEGDRQVAFVAPLEIPAPGAWKLAVTAGGATGTVPIQALDPGRTAPIGAPAPDIHTPTLADVGGVVRAVTTQPNPDLRLSQTSTSDARAAGRPYVLVIDSARFKTSPACGRALTMIRYLIDRWQESVDFIHLEPFEYQVITDEPVLSGSLTDPPLNQWSKAFGMGPDPWPATAQPWIMVVDGKGIVRAKYTGIVGSADIDVILTQLKQERAGG